MAKKTKLAGPTKAQVVKAQEALVKKLMLQGEQQMYIINALVWKLGLKTIDEVSPIIAAFTEVMAERLGIKEREAYTTVIPGFLPPITNEKDTDASQANTNPTAAPVAQDKVEESQQSS